MKRALVPGVLVLLLALSACSGTETTAGRSEATPAATTAQADGERSAMPAQPVEASATPAPPTKATAVLTAIQLTVASYGVDVMAAQVKEASDYACDQLAAGADEDSIIALTGDIPEGANRDLVTAAKNDYCPIR